MKKLNNMKINIVTGYVILVILAVLSWIMGTFIVSKIKEKGVEQAQQIEQIADTTQQLVEKLETPYEKTQRIKKTIVLENFENTTIRGQPTKWFYKNLVVNGVLKSGYLYVKASVDDKPLDSNGYVYIKLTGMVGYSYHEYGGHLIKSKSLQVSQSSDYTEFLYALSDIKYKRGYYDSDFEVISADWLSLLNGGHGQQTLGFTSTVGNGKIIEISFFYECVEGSECSLDLY